MGVGMIEFQSASPFILKTLHFQNDNREYLIEFNRVQVMQLMGDSAIGKSLFVSDLNEQKLGQQPHQEQQGQECKLLTITENNSEALELVKNPLEIDYDLVVIDNADILITEELDQAICEALFKPTKTYWIIIGRNWFNCCAYDGCRGTLVNKQDTKSRQKNEKNIFTVKYDGTMVN